MAFQDQVEDITSLSVSDTGELSQFLKDGVIDVTNRWLLVRPQDMESFERESSISDSQGLSVGGARIISVIREAGADGSSDGSTAWEPCSKISASMQSRAVDIDSLFYASKFHPVYTMNSDKTINVYPTPSSNNGFKVFYVNEEPRDITNNAALIHSHSDIKYFPNDKVYLVVMYAGIRLLQATMGSNVISLTSVPPDVPSLATVSFTAPTAPTTPSDPSISSPGVATVAKADISGDVPTYTKPYLDDIADSTAISGGSDNTTKLHRFSEEFTSIGDLSITAVPPDVPTISTISYSSATETDIGSVSDVTVTGITFPTADIPTYTKTSLQTTRVAFNDYWVISDFPDSDPGPLSITAVPPDTPDTPELSSVGTAPAYTKPTQTFDISQLETFLETNEDTELAQVQMARLQHELGEYQADIQNELNEFNKENVEFQATIQREIQEDTLTIQKYQADLAVYQAEVGSQVQEYTQKLQRYTTELGTVFQAWQKTESDSLQEYQLNIQNELNEFNMENADFQLKFQEVVQEAKDANQVALQNMQKDLARAQADAQSDSARRLQDAIQSMQDDVANNASLIQKFQTEITEYQAEVNTEVQEYQANWNKQLQEWSGYQKTVLQHYQIEIQNELNDFNKENARYQANIQAEIAKFQVDAAEAQKEGDLEFQTRIQNYTQELALFGGEVQKYQSEIQSGIQTMQGIVANNQALLTKYQAETVEYQAEVAAETQEQNIKMQHYQLLHSQLKAEYDQAFMIAAPQQQQVEA